MVKRPATMNDIAILLGVSRAAVSSVLNDKARERGISPSLEKQIRKTAKKIGYWPSLKARGPLGKKTMVIGLLAPFFAAEYGVPLIGVIESKAQDCGYQLLLAHHAGQLSKLEIGINSAIARDLDGLIIVPIKNMDKLKSFKQLTKTEIPTVFIDGQDHSRNSFCVYNDTLTATDMAVEKLLIAGHKKIAMFDAIETLDSEQRHEAFRKVLLRNGLLYSSSLFKARPVREDIAEFILQDVKQLLQEKDPATAFIVNGATRAVMIHDILESLGKSVPKDTSMILLTGTPPQTPFGQFDMILYDYKATAAIAFETLLSLIKGEFVSSERKISLKPVYVKGSTIKSIKF